MERLWRDLEEQRTLARQLQHALNSRGAVEQAKGIPAERHGATVGEAFAAMRSYARSNRRPLDDVAAGVIASLASNAVAGLTVTAPSSRSVTLPLGGAGTGDPLEFRRHV